VSAPALTDGDRAAGRVAPPGYVRGIDGKCYPRNMHEPVRWADGEPMTADERREIVVERRVEGLSLRAIAAELWVSQEQVRRDLSRADTGARDTIIGLDGKRYPARQVSRGNPVTRDTLKAEP